MSKQYPTELQEFFDQARAGGAPFTPKEKGMAGLNWLSGIERAERERSRITFTTPVRDDEPPVERLAAEEKDKFFAALRSTKSVYRAALKACIEPYEGYTMAKAAGYRQVHQGVWEIPVATDESQEA